MLNINKEGFYQVSDDEVTISAGKEIILDLSGDCKITVDCEDDLKLHLLNRGARKLTIATKLKKRLVITLALLNKETLDLDTQADLIEDQANLKIISASICQNDQKLNYDINHLAAATLSEVENYGVVLADSRYDCEIKGKIIKSSIGSEAYQTTRLMTNGKIAKIRVLPILMMEEKEIKAKHACSIGRLAEEQKHYLATRGLNESQIIDLIAKGYLKNILAEIDNKEFAQILNAQIESQVESLCLM